MFFTSRSSRSMRIASWTASYRKCPLLDLPRSILGRDHHYHHPRHTIIAISERRKQARSFLHGQERRRDAEVRRGHRGEPRRPGRSCKGETLRVIELPGRTGVAQVRWSEVGARTMCVCVCAGQRTARNTDTTLLSGPVKSLSRSKIGRRRRDARSVKLLMNFCKMWSLLANIYRRSRIARIFHKDFI